MKVPPLVPNQLPVPSEAAEKEKLKEVSRQFEALFVNQLVTEMRKTVNRGGLIPESQGEKVYQAMLDNEYSKKIAESEQIGLAKIIYHQLVRGRFGE